MYNLNVVKTILSLYQHIKFQKRGLSTKYTAFCCFFYMDQGQTFIII